MSRIRIFVSIVSLCIILAITACSPTSPSTLTPVSEPRYQTLTLDEFAAALEQESDTYTVVNVHIPYEGEVPNTDLQIAFNDLDALTSALPDRNAPIILYCRSGNMSEQAAHALAELGYTNVWDVPGGMNAWQNSGRTLLQTASSQ